MGSFLGLLLILFFVIGFTSGSLEEAGKFVGILGLIIVLMVFLLNNFSFGVAVPLFALIGLAASFLLPWLSNRKK